MSSKDLLRYSKQIILKQVGIIGQKKISSAKVLIVGMGGLGCPVALYLSNLGIKNIGIIDVIVAINNIINRANCDW